MVPWRTEIAAKVLRWCPIWRTRRRANVYANYDIPSA